MRCSLTTKTFASQHAHKVRIDEGELEVLRRESTDVRGLLPQLANEKGPRPLAASVWGGMTVGTNQLSQN